MTVLPALTLSVSVDRPPGVVQRYVCDPRTLPDWAPGFARTVHQDGDVWVVGTEAGPVHVAFVAPNDLGVADHRVTDGRGLDVTNPVRVITNGDGAEVLFTLFRAAGVSEDDFQRDVALVEADLRRLKLLLESGDAG